MRPELRLNGVGRRYGVRGPWVLRGVELDVAPGTLVRVEGTNGTGKLPLAAAAALASAATAAACVLSSRRPAA